MTRLLVVFEGDSWMVAAEDVGGGKVPGSSRFNWSRFLSVNSNTRRT